MPDDPTSIQVQLGPTQIRAKSVRFRTDVLLDEVTLESERTTFASPSAPGEAGKITVEELSIRIILSEPNLNAIIRANLPASAPVRNLSAAVLTEKMKINGQFTGMLVPVPFTLEARPRIVNGVRIDPDFLNLNASVVRLPAAFTEFLENTLRKNLTIDLASLPFPVYLDTVRCEPGRLLIEGKARIHWPPPVTPAASPFSVQAISASASETASALSSEPEQKALPSASSAIAEEESSLPTDSLSDRETAPESTARQE